MRRLRCSLLPTWVEFCLHVARSCAAPIALDVLPATALLYVAMHSAGVAAAAPSGRSPGRSPGRLRSSPVSPLPAASSSSSLLPLLLSSPSLSSLLLSFLSSSDASHLRSVCRQLLRVTSTSTTTQRREVRGAAATSHAGRRSSPVTDAMSDSGSSGNAAVTSPVQCTASSPPLPSFSMAASAASVSSRVAPPSPPSPACSSRSSTPSSARSDSSALSTHPLLRDDPDAFTASGWHKSSASCLLRATEAVDVCCHAIVSTNSRFHNSSSVSVESRRLALTVAVFERSLYAYALRISAAARQATQQQQQQHIGGASNLSSANSTPTLTAANQPNTAATQLQPPLAPPPMLPLPHAPFLPQLPYFVPQPLHTHSEMDEWQQSAQPQQPSPPLSYTSTIPSSSAHSLAASAIASNQRMQQHTQQQQTRFMQTNGHNGHTPSSAHRPPKLPLPLSHPSLPPTPTSAAPPTYSPLPASPIPPTVSAPPGAWAGHRSSSGAMLYLPPTTPIAAVAAAPQPQLQAMAGLDPNSIPAVALPASYAALNQAGQQSTAHPSRARTFSASPTYNSPALSQPSAMLHAASAASPLSGPLGHSAALLSAVPPSPTPRSSSPVDNTGLPSSPFGHSHSPLTTNRSLLSAAIAPLSSAVTSMSNTNSAGGANDQLASSVWHQPAGMTCLLRILTHQLLETRDVLLALNADCSSFPRYIRHLLAQSVHIPATAIDSAARQPRSVMMAASVMAFVSLLHNSQPLSVLRATVARCAGQSHLQLRQQLDVAAHSSAAAFLLSFIPPSIQSTVLTVASVLSPRVLLPQLRAALHTRAAFTIIPLALWLVFRLSRYRRISRLKALHSPSGLAA